MEDTNNVNILDKYLGEHWPDLGEFYSPDVAMPQSFQRFCTTANDILNVANFLLFPVGKTITIGDNEMISSCIFICDLIVQDKNFEQGIQQYKVEIDWDTLVNFDNLKSFLQLQAPTIYINEMNRKEKDKFCEDIRLGLLTGYELLFGIDTSHNVQRIGFDPKDRNKFVFSDGVLDISTGEFTPGEYNLTQNTSIKLSFPLEQMKNLTLEESLEGILSLKNYISSNKVTSAIILGYMIAGIFRNEYKDIHNEFPFLGIQSYTGTGKTSLLNLLSRVCGYDRDTILGTCDSEYAFEVGMNSMGGWFYFFDEVQKASNKLLKYIQAAYNSGENRKGGANGNWQDIQIYRKDCSLICTGEYLPQEEEALLNRFIIIDEKEPFLIKKNVKALEELEKYKKLTGNEPNNDFLTTEQIKVLAIKHYRPMFLNILRNKRKIDFNKYHEVATNLVEYIAARFDDRAPDTRLVNNMIAAITGYLILCGNNVDKEEVEMIISKYFADLIEYRSDAYVSGRIVNHIVDNVGEYCSRINKVKGGKYPMIYLKCIKEQGLAIQIPNLADYAKNRLDSGLTKPHIIQQFKELIGVPRLTAKAVRVAKGTQSINAIFIPLDIIKEVEPLKRIWDITLDYYGEHIKELKKMKSEDQKYVMDDSTLQELINEMEETYDNADFFDKQSYSKDNREIKKPF